MPASSLRLCFIALPALAAGCGGSDLVSGAGKVTYKGEPVPNAIVTFMPDEPGKRSSVGVSDAEGNFILGFARTQKGVLRGKHTVVVRYRHAADEVPEVPHASLAMKEAMARYVDPKTSPLHYEVTSNGQHFDIQLE